MDSASDISSDQSDFAIGGPSAQGPSFQDESVFQKADLDPSTSAVEQLCDFVLAQPPQMSNANPLVFYLDPDRLSQKPWRQGDADQAQYFNYGFSDKSWGAAARARLDALPLPQRAQIIEQLQAAYPGYNPPPPPAVPVHAAPSPAAAAPSTKLDEKLFDDPLLA